MMCPATLLITNYFKGGPCGALERAHCVGVEEGGTLCVLSSDIGWCLIVGSALC